MPEQNYQCLEDTILHSIFNKEKLFIFIENHLCNSYVKQLKKIQTCFCFLIPLSLYSVNITAFNQGSDYVIMLSFCSHHLMYFNNGGMDFAIVALINIGYVAFIIIYIISHGG